MHLTVEFLDVEEFIAEIKKDGKEYKGSQAILRVTRSVETRRDGPGPVRLYVRAGINRVQRLSDGFHLMQLVKLKEFCGELSPQETGVTSYANAEEVVEQIEEAGRGMGIEVRAGAYRVPVK
jgi:hypothetical protein